MRVCQRQVKWDVTGGSQVAVERDLVGLALDGIKFNGVWKGIEQPGKQFAEVNELTAEPV